MSSTIIWEARDEAETFSNGDLWLKAWLNRRSSGFETLILDGNSGALSVLLMHQESGRVVQLTCKFPSRADGRPMPQPSELGIGDTLAAERRLADDWPELGWVIPDRPTVRGKGLFVFPLGPVRADVAESLAYRLTVMGDEIIHLELQAGFKPRHIRELVQGRTISEAMPVISRFTTISNVHHTLAMAMAVEDAWEIILPEAVHTTRTLLAELERAVSHIGDLALLAVSTGLPVPQMEYLHLKETLLRVNYHLFGHRYLRGSVVPGGVDKRLWPDDTDPVGAARIVSDVLDQTSDIAYGLKKTPSFLDRLHGAGTIPSQTVSDMRPVGPVGRASGCPSDVRRTRPYADYSNDTLSTFTESSGDSYARFRVRVAELEESLSWVRRILGGWHPHLIPGYEPNPPWDSGIAPTHRSAVGVVEAPRGLLAYSLELDPASGRIIRLGVATPSERNWMVVPAAMANNNILQDFPIIDASFALSVAGWDG